MAARCSPGSQLRRVIKHLREELRLSMPLAGANSIKSLSAHYFHI
jgi:isopentenyl diphosphate isomerase/L-lactate dehydrogenase-like FMN-dependent dehydrogenase